MDPVTVALLRAGEGIVGSADRGGKRQVTLIDEDSWRQVTAGVGDVSPAVRRANLFVSGVTLENSRNRVLVVGACRIRVLNQTRPCERMEEAVPGLGRAMAVPWGGGAFGEVLDDGEIAVGDQVTWEEAVDARVERGAPVHSISEDDARFRDDFERGVVAPPAFTHRAHLRLAYIYLAQSDVEQALASMRRALQRFIEVHGIDPAKYHETLTTAWLLAVRHFMDGGGPYASAAAFIDANPRLLEHAIMLTHYSQEALFSSEARAAFVAPDVSPIPTRS